MEQTFTTNELQLVVTARKIRQFKEIIAKQRTLGADEEYLRPSMVTLKRLEQEFQLLSEQVLTIALD